MLNKKIDKEAYTSFIMENKEMLHRVAFGYLRDEAKSLDAVDEAIYRGYAHRHDLNGISIELITLCNLISDCRGLILNNIYYFLFA